MYRVDCICRDTQPWSTKTQRVHSHCARDTVLAHPVSGLLAHEKEPPSAPDQALNGLSRLTKTSWSSLPIPTLSAFRSIHRTIRVYYFAIGQVLTGNSLAPSKANGGDHRHGRTICDSLTLCCPGVTGSFNRNGSRDNDSRSDSGLRQATYVR